LLLNNLGYSYYLSGDELKARGLFNQALNFDTQYKRAIHNLALIEIRNGEFTSAAMLFNRIMSPHESYNNIGYIALLNGQYDVAEEYLRRAINECPVYFPKAQQNLKNLLAAKGSNMPYQATPEEVRQNTPAPEIQYDMPPEPSVNVEPEQNITKAVQPVKPAPQKIKAIALKSADKKAAKNKMIKTQQIAARPVKKTQPEIKQITDSNAALSDATKSVDLSDRAPTLARPKPSTASAQEKANPANKAQKPALPNHDQALNKPEDSKTETAQSLHAAQPQTVENNPHGVTAEHFISSPQQPVASPNSKESAQPPAVRVVEEQKKAVEQAPPLVQASPKSEESKKEITKTTQAIQPPAIEKQPTVIAERPIFPPQSVANPNPGKSAQPSPAPGVDEHKKSVELPPQPDSLSSSAVPVKTAAPGPDQPMTKGKQTENTGQSAASPKSELHPPSASSSPEPVKKQGIEVPQKFEAPTPLTPVNPLKKNDAFVTDIVVDK
jgi:Tfp pilus assembly protein PilF